MLIVDHHLLLHWLRYLKIYRLLVILVLNVLLRSNNLLRAPRIVCFLFGYYHVVRLLNSVYIYILLAIKTLIRLLVCILIMIINNIILLLIGQRIVLLLLLHEELLVITLQAHYGHELLVVLHLLKKCKLLAQHVTLLILVLHHLVHIVEVLLQK